jgi:hypothetical protein
MEIEFAERADLKDFRYPSLKVIEHKNKRLVLSVTADINPLLRILTKYRIKNMVFPEPSLEDMFMTFYTKD